MEAGNKSRNAQRKQNKKNNKNRRKRSIGSPPPRRPRRRLVSLNVLPQQLWLKVERGLTLWEALQNTDVDLEGDCGGLGKCGKCKLTVVSAIGPPTEEETSLLSKDELATGTRLACRTKINHDMQVDVGEAVQGLEYNQILKTGHRAIVHLNPLIDQHIVTSAPHLIDEGVADFDRIKFVLGPEYQDLDASLECLRTLPHILEDPNFEGAAAIHDNRLLALQNWEKVGRRYGLVFDLGTSTLVGKLISLLDGHEVAAISCLNSQYRYGANVISRLHYVKENAHGLQRLHNLLVRDLNRITDGLLEVGGIEHEDIFVAVLAGNTTMQHFLLSLPPLKIAQAPFSPVLTDGVVVKAIEIGLRLHPEAVMYVMPVASGYIGGDLISVVLASGAADQDRELVLALDLGTNGEIFLGNKKRLLTCSAAAGPALEGGRITHGMIAKTGAIEGVSTYDRSLYYRTIANTKPRGLCGSGLVDLVAVLVHEGVIDYEGLIVPPPDGSEHPLFLNVEEGDSVNKFLIAGPDDSFDGRALYLTQQDVRELQLAKGAIAAGIQTLMHEMDITAKDINRIYLAGALGNYVDVYSAMRIGLIPNVDPNIVSSLGNAASTGAIMVLLSKDHWKRASMLADSIEHIELSSQHDFNEYFVDNLDFPRENIW